MRITLKLISSLAVGIAVVAFLFAFLQVREDMKAIRRQTERHVATLAGSFKEQIEPRLQSRSHIQLAELADRFQSRENLAGVAIYDGKGESVVETSGTDGTLAREALHARPASRRNFRGGYFLTRSVPACSSMSCPWCAAIGSSAPCCFSAKWAPS